MLIPVADLGWIYGVTAVVLGAIFLGGTVALATRTRPRRARCGCSATRITYVTVLFGAMTVDVLVRYGW